MPNLNAIGQTKIMGVDGITITVGAVIVVVALILLFNALSKKRR
jgi:hypothetical protein